MAGIEGVLMVYRDLVIKPMAFRLSDANLVSVSKTELSPALWSGMKLS